MKSGSTLRKYNIIIIILILLMMSSQVSGNQDDRIIFNHSFHINEVELTCEECHEGIGNTENLSWTVFPNMDLCLNCHDGDTADDDCEKCHTNIDEPLAISESWIISKNNFSHKSHFNFIDSCQKCHDYIYGDDGSNEQKIWQSKECSDCHSKHEYTNDMTSCTNCHVDFHKGNNGNECQLCHTAGSWIIVNAADLHQTTRFPLVGAHLTADCEECHTTASFIDFEPMDVDCYSCHSQDYLNAQIPSHIINNITHECEECHEITSYSWDLNFSEHSFFPLVGGHTIPTCFECHTSTVFQNIDSECYSCHQTNYNSTQDPNHIALGISTDCSECHTTTAGWYPVNINHDIFYVLTGVHTTISDCQICHINGYANTSDECYSCHQSDYNSTQNPNHGVIGFSTDCENCHNTGPDWSPVNFDHSSIYLLTGAHKLIENECGQCHTQGLNMTSVNCYDCHSADYLATSDPSHTQYNFPQDCDECHNTNFGWSPIILDHNAFFPLTGGHEQVSDDCVSCHDTGFDNLLNECSDCHIDNYSSTTDPNHIIEQFPQDCEECHTTNPGWSPIVFDHSTVFEMTGGHSIVKDECTKCHSEGYSNIGTDCSNCHLSDYNNTINPNHINNQFSQDCEECHTTNPGWNPVSMDHSIVYPLTGAHSQVQDDCNLCHSTGFNNTSSECSECHLSNYNSTTNPNHANNQFPIECDECHSTGPGWTPTIFNHSTVFTLTGAHSLIQDDCIQCHASGYINQSTACESCHLSDYNNTTDPNHSNEQFSTSCEQCHNTNLGWTPLIFDHNTVFAMTGGHNLIKDDCNKCHSVGYSNIGTDCSNCHITDYNNTSDPNHVSNQFPQDCDECHTTNPGWSPTIFDHNSVFALTGGHSLIQDECIKCHSSGYSNTSSVCSSCHLSDYNSATDPSHVNNQFPTDCSECHTTNPGWSPVTFDHNTVFALTGAHNLIKDDCNRCHSSGYANTSSVCSSCHLSDYNSATDPSHINNQFPTDCNECHTTNPGWSPVTFDHNTVFALTGGHSLIQDECIKCHGSGYSNISSECFSCHMDDYNSTSDPNHVANQFPQDCEMCHTTNPGWTPSTFDHDGLYFPIYSGDHSGKWDYCSTCHTNASNYSEFTCFNCHYHNQINMNNKHHGVSDYVYNSYSCYDCHPNGEE